eukprot:g73303.t1
MQIRKYASFRLEFVVVFEQIKPQKINGCIQKVAVALRMLAGASYLDVADIHGVSDTSVYYILHRFCAAVNGRWGILWKPLRFDFKHAIPITKACMRLHNFLIDDNSSHISLMEMCLVPIDDEHGAGGYIENPPLIEDFLNTNNLKHVINKANVKRDKLAHDIYAAGLRRPGSAS